MGVTAISGPAINYGIGLSSSGAANEYNEERGPSLNDLGEGTLDPRPQFTYRPGNRPGTPVYAWPGCFGGPAVDFMPIALNSSGIAATFSSTGASATPTQVTLATSAVSSSIRLISSFQPSTFAGPVSVVMLDGFQGGVAVGQGSTSVLLGAGCGFGTPVQAFPQASALGPQTTVNIWNPLVMGGRALTITNSSATTSDAATLYRIAGFDVYGMFMTATINGAAAAATVTTTKAFKYILSSGITFTSTTPGTAPVNAVSIGVADVFGFPIYVDSFGYAQVIVGPSSGATLATGSSLHTFGYGSSLYGVVPTTLSGPSTGTAVVAAQSSLGDVRGTYTSSTATTGNTAASGSTGFRIVMNISPRVVNLATVSPQSFWGLAGVPQA